MLKPLVCPLMAGDPPSISTPDSNDIKTQDDTSDTNLRTIKGGLLQNIGEGTADSLVREIAAVSIQRYWRGYRTRRHFPVVGSMQRLQAERTNQHILRLYREFESLKLDLENQYKIRVLQVQATKAMLDKVQELHERTQEIIKSGGPNSRSNMSTQTEPFNCQEECIQELNIIP